MVENSVPAGTVNADREAIHQIFSNLIENALKYAATGKKIVLGARAAGGGVGSGVEFGIEFYVQDFGPGISSEHLPRLFERFYRVDKARSRESGGTGREAYCSGAWGNDSSGERTESRVDFSVYAGGFGEEFGVDDGQRTEPFQPVFN